MIWKSALNDNKTITHNSIKADTISTAMDYLQLLKQVSRLCKLIFTPYRNANAMQTTAWMARGGGTHKSIPHGLFWKVVSSNVKYIWLVVNGLKHAKALIWSFTVIQADFPPQKLDTTHAQYATGQLLNSKKENEICW